MLGKLILILLQIVAAWFAAPVIRSYIPTGGAYDLLLYAVIFAIVVYLTGVLAALVIKDVGTPSGATLTAAVVLALIAAAVLTFVPEIVPNIPGGTITNRGIVLAFAILGYLIKR